MEQTKEKWSKEQLEFLKKWYGAIKTLDILSILGRSGTSKSVSKKVIKDGIKANPKVYGIVQVEYQGKVTRVKSFIKRATVTKPRVQMSREEQRIQAALCEERRARYQLQVDSNNSKIVIPPYVQPEGTKLVLVCSQPKTWKILAV